MDEIALADKLYVTGDRCFLEHIFSFIGLEVHHFSASLSDNKLISLAIF
jgi:hypothetical protein